jgi:hypothetical protein
MEHCQRDPWMLPGDRETLVLYRRRAFRERVRVSIVLRRAFDKAV